MKDLAQHHNIPEYTVSSLSQSLKKTVEGAYGYVRVTGEISGFTKAASGHMYLRLKDEKSVLDAVCWKGVSQYLTIAPENGLDVVCTGRLTTYPGRSNYQLIIERIEANGVGALMALLEKRKQMLTAEGLFDASHKKELPFLPKSIAIITSLQGAVIQDILHRLADRFPCPVLIWPVTVQGQHTANEVSDAITSINQWSHASRPAPDLIIIARGGGSLEDLWAFNEENLVRAAFASHIPIISAIGHETDTSLLDYVADYRAPTPTAAAEKAVPVKISLIQALEDFSHRLISRTSQMLIQQQRYLATLSHALTRTESLTSTHTQRFDELVHRLTCAIPHIIRRHEEALQLRSAQLQRPSHLLSQKQIELTNLGHRLTLVVNATAHQLQRDKVQLTHTHHTIEQHWQATMQRHHLLLTSLTQRLASVDYTQVLQRGYSILRDQKQQVVSSITQLAPNHSYSLELHDGTATLRLEKPTQRK
jgi:exodeoxyribonuclease VII large subunit